MFVDDPLAEEYDKHGRYCRKETLVHQTTGIGSVMGDADNDSLNLFHRGNRKAQLEQLKHMNYKPNFFQDYYKIIKSHANE